MTCYIEKHKELLSVIKYYNDLSGCRFTKLVLKNLNSLEMEKETLNCEIDDLMTMYQYLWSLSFQEFITNINKYEIEEFNKSRILELGKKIRPNNKSFISFINNNFQFVLKKENHFEVRWQKICTMLLDLIYNKFSKMIEDKVFLYVEKTMPLILLERFDLCQKYYWKPDKKSNFESLFANLYNTRAFEDRTYVDFLIKINKSENYIHYNFLRKVAKFICERNIEAIKKKEINTDNEEIMELASKVEEYLRLAKLFKLECYYEYLSQKSKIDKGVEEYVHKHGHHFEHIPLDISDVIDVLKKDDNPLRFIGLTHVKKDEKFINQMDETMFIENADKLSEIFEEYGNPRSEKYPYYIQHSMDSFLALKTIILYSIFSDDKLFSSFGRYLIITCSSVEEKYFNNEIKLFDEYIGAFEVLKNIVNMDKNKKGREILIKALENGCCVNLCGTIEKVLRNVLIKEIKDFSYFDPDLITINQILKSSNKLADISTGCRYYLEFYLSVESDFNGLKEKRPGKSIRNEQMHNKDGKYEKTNLQLALLLFYLAFSLLVDLFLEANDE